MNHYRKLTFNHANLKRPVNIVAGTIAGWHWSDASKSTVVYTTAGIFPVEETDEQISQMIESLNSPIGQEKKNEPTEQAVRRPPGNVRKRQARKDR